MFSEHRIGCVVDTQYPPVLQGFWCSGCIGLLLNAVGNTLEIQNGIVVNMNATFKYKNTLNLVVILS